MFPKETKLIILRTPIPRISFEPHDEYIVEPSLQLLPYIFANAIKSTMVMLWSLSTSRGPHVILVDTELLNDELLVEFWEDEILLEIDELIEEELPEILDKLDKELDLLETKLEELDFELIEEAWLDIDELDDELATVLQFVKLKRKVPGTEPGLIKQYS